LNSRLTIQDIGAHCRLDEQADRVFWQSQACLGLSARSYHHALRVARTIADLEPSDSIRDHHVAEALQLKRGLS
jgi:magnesium chelatase family protein